MRPESEAAMGTEEFGLKTISMEGAQRAREKAFRYRLLNEPHQAESICRDILAIDPENQDAIRVLLLSITDQISSQGKMRAAEAIELLERLENEYDRLYYHGVIAERKAAAQYARGLSGEKAYEMLRECMDFYEQAERLSAAGNDDAILRWNTCARLINSDPKLHPAKELQGEAMLVDEDVPLR